MPAKTDLLLAEAKPISNSSGASGIICLEREGNIVQLHMEEGKGVTICERSSSADTEGVLTLNCFGHSKKQQLEKEARDRQRNVCCEFPQEAWAAQNEGKPSSAYEE
ncbi:hypothetical protein TURU_149680 [Turdus rufiventris]|nr:hypothetical protein TURU_149680 [Turdus rufiventris]